MRPAPYFTDREVTIWHGNALDLPLDDASVDLICTSPPYFGLRAYSDGGETYSGQIGSEATPGEFIDALAAATREMMRVLKPSGSIFVNLGDKYAGSPSGPRDLPGGRKTSSQWSEDRLRTSSGVPAKSLMLLPERYRIRCVDDLGLIARAIIVWDKPNGLPESVRDRVRRSHEDWVHLTKESRYFTGIDEIREEHQPYEFKSSRNDGRQYEPARPDGQSASTLGRTSGRAERAALYNPLGKLPGSVWRIPTQPLRVPPELGIDHFAAFPLEWPRRIIRGWSPAGICVDCGEGRRPVADRERFPLQAVHNGHTTAVPDSPDGRSSVPHGSRTTITGYACACDAPTAPTCPAVILDPFGGTGTVALMARVLGRQSHSVDLSLDYCRLQRWRVTDPGERARAMQVDKPAPPPAGVDALFDLDGAAS